MAKVFKGFEFCCEFGHCDLGSIKIFLSLLHFHEGKTAPCIFSKSLL